MSKKFKTIHPGINEYPEITLPIENFLDEGKPYYLIADLCFSKGRHLISHGQQWLKEGVTQQRLIYLALIEEPIVSFESDGSALGDELAEKWPPLLPGIHEVHLAKDRVQLMLVFGPPEDSLKCLLSFGEPLQEKTLRAWSIDRWLWVGPAPNQDLQKLIHQFSHAKSMMVSDVSQPWFYHPNPMPTLKIKNAPWVFAKNKALSGDNRIIIIGAGLAGCYLARLMANSGWKVTLLDKEKHCAKIGSGNTHSVLYPKFSLYQAPFTQILHQCYPFSYAVWSEFLSHQKHLGRISELWQKSESEELHDFLKASPTWFSFNKGLVVHKSCIVDMPKLCEYLIDHPQIEVHYEQNITSLEYREDLWRADDFQAPVCVIANGYQTGQFSQTKHLSIEAIRGQMTYVQQVHEEDTVFCDQGHFSPLWKQVHAVGATFTPNNLSLEPNIEDDFKNLRSWESFFNTSFDIKGHWVGIRGVSLDHIPIVGPVPQSKDFLETFQSWQHHANLTSPELMPNYPGLFVFSGFGSRGLLTIPWLAEILKAQMTQSPLLVSNDLLQALSPARFLRKKIKKYFKS